MKINGTHTGHIFNNNMEFYIFLTVLSLKIYGIKDVSFISYSKCNLNP